MIQNESVHIMKQDQAEEKITIEDVATRSGYSRATVSRVINREGSVRPATIAKVQQAIEQLGYAPNGMAQALSGGKTRTLAVVLPDVLRQYYSYLLAGADAVAEEKGYHLLIKTGNCAKAFLDLIEQRRVDGFIIRNAGEPAVDTRILARLARHGLPCLFIGRPPDGSVVPSIQIDNVGGARAMARHYAEHSFRKILFITGSPNSIDSNDRVYGFKLGLSESGIDPEGVVFAEGDFSRETAYQAAARHLSTVRFQAVFAGSDQAALGVLNWCNDQGVRIPEDLALTGFDDSLFADCLWPPLTTVRQPMYEIGASAVQTIIGWLEGSPARQMRTILPTQLVVRRSCGCIVENPG
jgi:LacI family transcriptional regulator